MLVELLRGGPARSQEQIAEALARFGEHATQATVSRDLAAIGAVKGADGYHLPGNGMVLPGAAEASGELERAIREHAVEVTQADSLVVVRTAPGHAGVVGAVLDRCRIKGVVGTIAGDDTIFLATVGPKAAAIVAERLAAPLEAGASGEGTA